MRFAWYVRRLRAMSVAEVGWRARRVATASLAPVGARLRRPHLADDVARAAALARFRRADEVPVLLDAERAPEVMAAHPEEAARLLEAAEHLVSGRVQYFGYPEVLLSAPVDWSRDLVTGHDWPDVPSARLDHRSAPADPKWIWELNRLQHLPLLAEAYLASGREEFATCALEHLDSWLDQNPVGRGIAWRGAFEAGVRAISVAVALQGLRGSGALTADRYAAVVQMLRDSARICWRERSLFSSANNHLVGEMAGLAVVATMFPELPEARRWRRRALRVLQVEADRQLLPDGAGAEQAVGYQVFTSELLLVVAVLARAGGRSVPVLERAVTRSAQYLADVVGNGDPAPRYGDDDEGVALRLGPEELRTVSDHLGIVSAVGSHAPVVAGGLTAAWYRSATRGGPGGSLAPAAGEPGSWHARDGGLVVLRDGGRRLTVDVGPLGYLAIAAHGHADALALTLSLDGERVVDDPGTGSYYGHPAWRRAHRSTQAHATLTVDGEDQSVNAGPFMWSDHARVGLLEVDLSRGVVDAEHDGYLRLPHPVVHRRRVVAAPHNDTVLVVDVVHGRGHHRVGLAWPLAPGLRARSHAWGHLVSRQGRDLLKISTAGTVPVVHDHLIGDEETHLGWWSDRLESRVPAYLLRSVAEGSAPLVLATLLHRAVGRVSTPADLRVELAKGEATVTWRVGGRIEQARVDVSLRAPSRPHYSVADDGRTKLR